MPISTLTFYYSPHNIMSCGVLQLLDECIARPQQGFLGHLVEPERFLADCERLGLRVDVTGSRH